VRSNVLMLLMILTFCSLCSGQERSYVDVPLYGLDIQSAPTNVPAGYSRVCDNWVFDRFGSLVGRKGLEQWNNVTRSKAFDFVYAYTDPGGGRWYLARNADTLWITSASDGIWENDEYLGTVINDGTVDLYTASPDLVHGDGLYNWRTVAGAGTGLQFTVDGSTYDVETILSDSLMRVDATWGSNKSDEAYYLQLSYGILQDAAVANEHLFLATNNGLYKFDGYNLTTLSDTLGYYKWDIDSVTYSPAGTQFNNLRFYCGTYRGTGSDPGIGAWVLNKFASISNSYICFDSATHHPSIADHEMTHQWLISAYDPTAKYVAFRNSFVAPSPRYDSDTNDVIIYDVSADEDAITFTANIDWDSIAQPIGPYTYARYAKITPTDSTSWDSTRFESGDWVVTADGYSFAIFLVGLVDSSGSFWGSVFNITAGDLWGKTCTARRYPKETASFDGEDYLVLEVYKDRLWTVTADNPDLLLYSYPFEPDSLDKYESLGLDLSDGDEIVFLATMFGELYICSQNTIHKLSGGTIISFDLRQVAYDVGVSAPKAALNLGFALFLPHETGFYLFDGNTPTNISQRISPIVEDSINWDAAYSTMVAEYYDDHIWISYPSGSSTTNNRTLVYHLPSQQWGTMSFHAGAFERIINSADTNEFLIADADSGALYVYKGNDDGGNDIDFQYSTGWNLFGDQHIKEIAEYVMTYNAACSLIVNINRNDTLVAADTIYNTGSQTFKTARKSLENSGAHGQYLQLDIDIGPSSDITEVHSVTLGVVRKGAKAYDP